MLLPLKWAERTFWWQQPWKEAYIWDLICEYRTVQVATKPTGKALQKADFQSVKPICTYKNERSQGSHKILKKMDLLCLQATEQISRILLGPGIVVIHSDGLLSLLLLKKTSTQVLPRQKKKTQPKKPWEFLHSPKMMNNMNSAVHL